jgi:hypothetical protein
VRCAENALRDHLGVKSKLALAAYPGELAEAIDGYKAANLSLAQSPRLSKTKSKKAPEWPEISPPPEFKPDIRAAAEIEKQSWDTTMTLVELQNRDAKPAEYSKPEDMEDNSIIIEDDGEFIAIDTGNDEDIFDLLEELEKPELTNTGKFAASLSELEFTALEILLEAENKDFDMICGEFLSETGAMMESVIDAINEKAMDFIGDIVFDTEAQKIIEDYKAEINNSRSKKHE